MAKYSGKDLYIEFAGVEIDGDQRSFTVNRSSDTIETTAGADEDKTYIARLKDATGSFDILEQTTTGGTAIYAALVEGSRGTLVFGPEGTATGKPKYECVAIITAADVSYPYNDVAMRNYSWQRDGAWITDYNSDPANDVF